MSDQYEATDDGTDGYSLVCPFLTDDLEFCKGVEFGLLFARLTSQPEVVRDYFLRSNQEQILLLFNRAGYAVRKVKPRCKDWFYIVARRMEREVARTDPTDPADC